MSTRQVLPLLRIAGAMLLGATLFNVSFAAPEFSGVLTSGGVLHVCVRADADQKSMWVRVGEDVGAYHVKSYNRQNETVSLVKAGVVTEVKLNTAAVQPVPTLSYLEQLARAGDESAENIFQSAKQLDKRRQEAAAELATVESQPAGGNRTTHLADLRRRLKLEEDNLSYLLQAAVRGAQTSAAKAAQRSP